MKHLMLNFILVIGLISLMPYKCTTDASNLTQINEMIDEGSNAARDHR